MIRCRVVGERFAELLDHPLRCRMERYVYMNDPASFVVNYEPHIRKTKRDRGHDEEIHRSNAVPVVTEKGHPALVLSLGAGLFRHVPRNGCEADREAKLPEFRMNLSSAPAIVQGECLDECLNLKNGLVA